MQKNAFASTGEFVLRCNLGLGGGVRLGWALERGSARVCRMRGGLGRWDESNRLV